MSTVTVRRLAAPGPGPTQHHVPRRARRPSRRRRREGVARDANTRGVRARRRHARVRRGVRRRARRVAARTPPRGALGVSRARRVLVGGVRAAGRVRGVSGGFTKRGESTQGEGFRGGGEGDVRGGGARAREGAREGFVSARLSRVVERAKV